MPGSRGLSRRSPTTVALCASRAASVTLRPARVITLASATPQAPAPITAILWNVIGSNCLARWRRARDQVGQWPARMRRRLERIDQPEREPLGARPGNHGAVVGAQLCRWRDQQGAAF